MKLIACPECDLLLREQATEDAGTARCGRCGAVLDRAVGQTIDHSLTLASACAVLLILANVFPLVTLEVRGDELTTTLPGAVWSLYHHHMIALAVLVFATTSLAPAGEVAAIIYLLLGLRLRLLRGHFAPVFRCIRVVHGWGMIDVLMLGILVAIVKLSSLAHVVPGVALWSFGALLVLLAALSVTFNPRNVWRWYEEQYPCVR